MADGDKKWFAQFVEGAVSIYKKKERDTDARDDEKKERETKYGDISESEDSQGIKWSLFWIAFRLELAVEGLTNAVWGAMDQKTRQYNLKALWNVCFNLF